MDAILGEERGTELKHLTRDEEMKSWTGLINGQGKLEIGCRLCHSVSWNRSGDA